MIWSVEVFSMPKYRFSAYLLCQSKGQGTSDIMPDAVKIAAIISFTG